MASAPRKPLQGEGDVNSSCRRAEWQARTLEPEVRGLSERDARTFLHQSLPAPCLSAVGRAQRAYWRMRVDGAISTYTATASIAWVTPIRW